MPLIVVMVKTLELRKKKKKKKQLTNWIEIHQSQPTKSSFELLSKASASLFPETSVMTFSTL